MILDNKTIKIIINIKPHNPQNGLQSILVIHSDKVSECLKILPTLTRQKSQIIPPSIPIEFDAIHS
jgi:hypothetical protein